MVLDRLRPATAQGIIFITLEDETGTSNLLVHSSTFERYCVDGRPRAVPLATAPSTTPARSTASS